MSNQKRSSSDRDQGGKEGAAHKLIHHLIQLQELTIARDQQHAAGGRLESLDESIGALMGELEPSVANQFARLRKKSLLVMVPVANQVCTACGMVLPISQVQLVRQARTLHACPSCARLLYYPDVALRAKGRWAPRGAVPKVGLARFSSPELILPRLEAKTRDEAITEMCQRLEDQGYVEDAAHIATEALKREAVASTAVDHGLAFPHVRGVEGGGLVMVLGISKKGIRFDEADRSLSRILCFMVIPTAASAFYLKLLAGLTQTFRDKEAREKVLAEEDAEKLWKTLVKLTRSTLK